MERLTPFPGKVAPCSCGKQPRQLFRGIRGGQYAVTCCPCQCSTAFYPTLQQAVEEWEQRQTPPIARTA